MDSIIQNINTDYDAFIKKHKLTVITHKSLPLLTLNYDNRAPRTVVNDMCRGLTLEKSGNQYNIISVGMCRFRGNNNDKIRQVQSKEDGSMIMLFYYQNNWLVKCRYNFAEYNVQYSEKSYGELFDEFKLDYSNLDNNYTYVFEMCSISNRIIKKYNTPQLFLLAAVNNKDYTELDFNKLNRVADELKVDRPTIYGFKTMTELKQSFSLCPMTFEGYVVITDKGERVKIKNPLYIVMHTLKYRNWVSASAFVKQITDHYDEIITTLKEFGFSDDELVEIEYVKTNRKDDRYHHNFCDVFEDKKYEVDLAEKPIGKIVKCVCGSTMVLTKLIRDWCVPSYCYCGKRNGFYKIANNNLLYICGKCQNTHEAKQDSGLPRGIACSKECKIYRLHAHWMLNHYIKKNKLSKNIGYIHLSKMLGLDIEETHIALFGINMCKKVIISLST